MKISNTFRKSLLFFTLSLGVFGYAGRGGRGIAVSNPNKYLFAKTPLDANDLKTVEVIVSLPRIENTYGHTAFRLKFYSGKTLETGFVVENFKDQKNGGGAKSPIYLEMYSDSSSQSMYRRREFKLEYAPLLLRDDEKVLFIQNLNQIAANGTGEAYSLYTNNCATMAMKLIKSSLINRTCGVSSNPANVVSVLANAGLVDETVEDRVNQSFKYYKSNPWNPNAAQ